MANDREDRLQRLLDRQDIVDCLSRMARAADRMDRDLFLSGMHSDCITSAGPFVGGPEELYDWSEVLQKDAYSATFHKLLNNVFEFDGDSAHVETYYFFVGCMGENNILAGGRYIDRFEKRDGIWGLAMRNNYVEWTSMVPALASPLGEIADLAVNGLPARDSSDPSYERPLTNRRDMNIPGG
ncbi:MAG: nuclear transport factor 2 family protein [Novosphingobium sp.]|nr:nuclear transport factor 2 family protein [Novosphingobium sp.]